MNVLQSSRLRVQGAHSLRASIQNSTRPARPARLLTPVKAAQNNVEDCETNINDFCSLDSQGRKPVNQMTLGEKEQAFLEALSSFYYDGAPAMSDQEFDLLKDELLWGGSKVAVLSANEQKFLEASMAYNAGKPKMSNEEFDALKNTLKKENSIVTAQGARCSLRTRKMYSDAQVDYLRMVALNLPAAITVLLALFSIDDLTGFEVTQLMELPEPLGIIVVWGFVLPLVYVLSNAITNLVFKDALVLKAQCPSCGTENFTYFGDILTVSGSKEDNTVECPACKAKLTFNKETREVEVSGPPPAVPAKQKVAA